MSRLYVDRISPYQSGSVQVDGLSIDTGSLTTKTEFNAFTASAATTGSNTFNGNQTINGTLSSTFNAPAQGSEVGFFNVNNASVSGKSYGRVFNGIADYGNFGANFEDYFAIEYYDGFGYNFGSEFNLNGKQSLISTKASGSGQISYIRTTDNYNGTSEVTIGSPNKISISGSVSSNSYITQNFTAPADNQEKAFANISGAQIAGKNYNRVYFGIADYPGFGNEFQDYFAIEYYDSTGYNFGSEFNVNGKNTILTSTPSGSGFSGRAYVQTIDNYDGTADVNIASNSGRINIQTVMNLTAQDPLPTGTTGDLAVSGSNLYFHNGTSWGQIN